MVGIMVGPTVIVMVSQMVSSIVGQYNGQQGFMQDKIIASHTCFGGHMEVNC